LGKKITLTNKNKKNVLKDSALKCCVFCPTFDEDTVFVKRYWLSSSVIHWSHPKD
jgi:hypothetical protein